MLCGKWVKLTIANPGLLSDLNCHLSSCCCCLFWRCAHHFCGTFSCLSSSSFNFRRAQALDLCTISSFNSCRVGRVFNDCLWCSSCSGSCICCDLSVGHCCSRQILGYRSWFLTVARKSVPCPCKCICYDQRADAKALKSAAGTSLLCTLTWLLSWFEHLELLQRTCGWVGHSVLHQSLIFDFCLVSTTIAKSNFCLFRWLFSNFPSFSSVLLDALGVWVVGWILPRFPSFYSSVVSVAQRASQQQTYHTYIHTIVIGVVIWTGLNRIEQSHKKASCRRRSSLCTQQKNQYSCPAPTPAPIFATKTTEVNGHDTTMRHLSLQEVHLGFLMFLDMNSFPEPSRHLWPCKRCALHRLKLRLSCTSVQRSLQNFTGPRFGLAPLFSWGITNIRYMSPGVYVYI